MAAGGGTSAPLHAQRNEYTKADLIRTFDPLLVGGREYPVWLRDSVFNYEAEANCKYAANLKGKLLLMTGDLDCNNPPAETMRAADAIKRAAGEDEFRLVMKLIDHHHVVAPRVTATAVREAAVATNERRERDMQESPE